MKYEISADDIKIMQQDMETNRTLKHLENMSFYKFSVGDVLVREDKFHLGWKASLAGCGLPYKYVYVFENKLGVGYIRRLSVNGKKFVDVPICVLNFDPAKTRFSLDPEYADHILLSPDEADFDAKSRYAEIKKRRERIHRKNKKARLYFSDAQACNEWLKSLNIGDKLWRGSNLGNIGKEPMHVHKVYVDKNPDLSWLQVLSSPNGYPYKQNVKQLMGSNIFTSRPFFLDEEI